MRGFFFLLILTNLALAGWFYWQTEPPLSATQPPSRGASPGGLKLLSELPPPSLQPVQAPTTPITPPTANGGASSLATESAGSEPAEETAAEGQIAICQRINPIAKVSDMEAVAGKLLQANFTVLERGEGDVERQTYWVMVNPYQTEKAARGVAAQLAKAKVRDFLVIRSGEYENGISLGLFSQKEGAENRLREISALKLNIRKPVIRQRTASVHTHWLTVRLSGDHELSALLTLLDAEGLQSSAVACPQ